MSNFLTVTTSDGNETSVNFDNVIYMRSLSVASLNNNSDKLKLYFVDGTSMWISNEMEELMELLKK